MLNVFYCDNEEMLINVSCQNVDTEQISKMLIDILNNIFHLFSTKISNLAMQNPLVVTTSLFNLRFGKNLGLSIIQKKSAVTSDTTYY